MADGSGGMASESTAAMALQSIAKRPRPGTELQYLESVTGFAVMGDDDDDDTF
jgi:hypothetical protein